MTTIGYDNLIDLPNISLSATNEISTLPISNVTHTHLAKVARINGNKTVISIDLGEIKDARQLALVGTNHIGFILRDSNGDPVLDENGEYTLTGGGTVLTASTSSQSGTDVLNNFKDFDADRFHKQVIGDFGDVRARYFELTLETEVFSDGGSNLEIGRIFLGPVIELGIAIAYGFETSVIDPSETRRTLGGQQFIWQLPQRRQASFTYGPGITANEGYSKLVRTLDRIAGKRQEVLFTPLQDDYQLGYRQALWGFITELGTLSHTSFNVFEKDYVVEETN